jgi:uncharacterized protein with PIN domain
MTNKYCETCDCEMEDIETCEDIMGSSPHSRNEIIGHIWICPQCKNEIEDCGDINEDLIYEDSER